MTHTHTHPLLPFTQSTSTLNSHTLTSRGPGTRLHHTYPGRSTRLTGHAQPLRHAGHTTPPEHPPIREQVRSRTPVPHPAPADAKLTIGPPLRREGDAAPGRTPTPSGPQLAWSPVSIIPGSPHHQTRLSGSTLLYMLSGRSLSPRHHSCLRRGRLRDKSRTSRTGFLL